MYAIRVRPINPKKCCVYLLHRIKRKTLSLFKIIVVRSGETWKSTSYVRLRRDQPWLPADPEGMAVRIADFWSKTKHACSKEWTEFWHMKKIDGQLSYTVYGCTRYYLKWNFES